MKKQAKTGCNKMRQAAANNSEKANKTLIKLQKNTINHIKKNALRVR